MGHILGNVTLWYCLLHYLLHYFERHENTRIFTSNDTCKKKKTTGIFLLCSWLTCCARVARTMGCGSRQTVPQTHNDRCASQQGRHDATQRWLCLFTGSCLSVALFSSWHLFFGVQQGMMGMHDCPVPASLSSAQLHCGWETFKKPPRIFLPTRWKVQNNDWLQK